LLIIRPALWPQDVPALAALNTSFVTNTVYRLAQDGFSFRLVEEAVAPPLHKRYAFAPVEERANWDHAAVAEDNGRLVGFGAAQYAAWNRRAILWHLYVAPEYRGQGVGTRLLFSVEAFAREMGARCVWLETQTVNFPAIQFYLRAGFTLCGLDMSLYDPDGPEGREWALFFRRPVSAVTESDNAAYEDRKGENRWQL